MQTQILAALDSELVKQLKKKLIDDGLSYRAWLERQILEYLALASCKEENP
jgi:hypothetical protein